MKIINEELERYFKDVSIIGKMDFVNPKWSISGISLFNGKTYENAIPRDTYGISAREKDLLIFSMLKTGEYLNSQGDEK